MCFHVAHLGQILKTTRSRSHGNHVLSSRHVDRVNHLMMSRNSQDPLLSGDSAEYKMKLTFNVNPGSDFSISGPYIHQIPTQKHARLNVLRNLKENATRVASVHGETVPFWYGCLTKLMAFPAGASRVMELTATIQLMSSDLYSSKVPRNFFRVSSPTTQISLPSLSSQTRETSCAS